MHSRPVFLFIVSCGEGGRGKRRTGKGTEGHFLALSKIVGELWLMNDDNDDDDCGDGVMNDFDAKTARMQ